MKIDSGFMCACLALTCIFPLTAHAHYYGQFDDPVIKREMAHSMLYPTAIIEATRYGTQGTRRAQRSAGSGTLILSSRLETSIICAVELVMKDDPLCSGDKSGKHTRSYILSNHHIFELFQQPEGGTGRLDEKMGEEIPIPFENLTIVVSLYAVSPGGSTEFNKTSFPATLVAYDKKKDLVLLRLEHDVVLPYVARIAPRRVRLEPFDAIWTIGAPGGYGPMPTFGLFGSRKEMIGDRWSYLSSALIAHRSSGGPVFHYTGNRFELISVTRSMGVAGSTGYEIRHVALSIPLEHIHEFLETNHLGFLFSMDLTQTPR